MKKLIVFIFAIFILFGVCALSEEVKKDGNFEYIVLEDGTAEIVGNSIYGGSKAVVNVPATDTFNLICNDTHADTSSAN